jgi:hypothetical protein
MDLDSITPVSEDVIERIERLHQNEASAMPRALAALVAGLRGGAARLLQIVFAPKSGLHRLDSAT